MIFKMPAAFSSAQESRIFGLNGYVGEPVLRRDHKQSGYVRYPPTVQAAATAKIPVIASNSNDSSEKLHDTEEYTESTSEGSAKAENPCESQNSETEIFTKPQSVANYDNYSVSNKPEHGILSELRESSAHSEATITHEAAFIQPETSRSHRQKNLTAKGMFWFMALISIPIVNIAVLLICAFKRGVNANYRAVARAAMIWFLILTTAILAAVTTLFFMKIPIDITSCYMGIRGYLDGVLL